MKSFKDYLTEGKKTYEFKVKVAGDVPKDFMGHIKTALDPYKVESCSAGKTSPIQEHQQDFPTLKNVSMSIFEVTTAYPANSVQVRDAIAACAKMSLSNIIVRTLGEEKEVEINRANAEKSGKALIVTDYEASNNQDLVGEKYMMTFLKELNKETRITGDEIATGDMFAKSVPTEKLASDNTKVGTVSALGTKQIKLPDPMKGR